MNTLDIVKGSFINLKQSKLRTILTMLGMIIGIGAVILIVSIGAGQQKVVQNLINKFGGNTIQFQINPNAKYNSKLRVVSSDYFTKSDIKLLKQNPNVKHVAPLITLNGRIIKQINNKKFAYYQNIMIYGTNASIFNVYNVKFLYGHTFSNNRSTGIIIDAGLSNLLFHTTNSVGKKFKVIIRSDKYKGIYTYVVSGVVTSIYSSMNKLSKYKTYTLYLSLASIGKITGNVRNFDNLMVKPYKNTNLITFDSQLLNSISKFHNTSQQIYMATPMSKWFSSWAKYLKKNNEFMIFIAAISLLVGGIGIMNIMLVTVTERTREIGIRKAIGATNKNILIQFLIEALILTIFGGILGIIFGYFAGQIIGNDIIHISPIVTLNTILLATLISCTIGIVFGVYPAYKASKLEPIDALRYE